MYQRMKYGQDQREWVKAADEKIPLFLEDATKCQHRAAVAFADFQSLPLETQRKMAVLQDIIMEEYANARMHLFQAIYYNGMRNANQPDA